ncbi:MAG TPA: hypothetical protein VKY29_01050 [Cryomorphaceae bacterium]|nr:hypothetical protein [Cryomorphaceae bacterium]
MALASVMLLGMFLYPVWQINLSAPQFPEGLELNIWVNKLSGGTDDGTDIIQNINILNHYIGMKYIYPDSIPELKYFPIIIFVMVGLGLLFTAFGKPSGYLIWFILMVILGILAIYDFYLWLYDYGHDLDPNAPIQIPGMSYMPPLFGEKDLLNFYVTSYPHMGTAFMSLAMVFSALAFWTSRNKKKK